MNIQPRYSLPVLALQLSKLPKTVLNQASKEEEEVVVEVSHRQLDYPQKIPQPHYAKEVLV